MVVGLVFFFLELLDQHDFCFFFLAKLFDFLRSKFKSRNSNPDSGSFFGLVLNADFDVPLWRI